MVIYLLLNQMVGIERTNRIGSNINYNNKLCKLKADIGM